VLLNDYDHADSRSRQPIGTWRVRAMQIRERSDSLRFIMANDQADYGIDVRQFVGGRIPPDMAYPFVRGDGSR